MFHSIPPRTYEAIVAVKRWGGIPGREGHHSYGLKLYDAAPGLVTPTSLSSVANLCEKVGIVVRGVGGVVPAQYAVSLGVAARVAFEHGKFETNFSSTC